MSRACRACFGRQCTTQRDIDGFTAVEREALLILFGRYESDHRTGAFARRSGERLLIHVLVHNVTHGAPAVYDLIRRTTEVTWVIELRTPYGERLFEVDDLTVRLNVRQPHPGVEGGNPPLLRHDARRAHYLNGALVARSDYLSARDGRGARCRNARCVLHRARYVLNGLTVGDAVSKSLPGVLPQVITDSHHSILSAAENQAGDQLLVKRRDDRGAHRGVDPRDLRTGACCDEAFEKRHERCRHPAPPVRDQRVQVIGRRGSGTSLRHNDFTDGLRGLSRCGAKLALDESCEALFKLADLDERRARHLKQRHRAP